MPIFQLHESQAQRVKLTEFKLEKDLQHLVESNLHIFFNCRFVASEFSTGNIHAGRIDTLALSEDGNPVIIEYKKVASSDLINQSLYYLHWLTDHKGDFQMAVNKTLGGGVEVDWSDIRVICLAPEYKKYDLHAVQVMGANIELWQYKLFENRILQIEEVYRRSESSSHQPSSETKGKSPIMVEAGRKAAITRKTAVHTIEQHLNSVNPSVAELFELIRNYIMNLNEGVDESPKKHYIAYKTSQNFVCLKTHKDKIRLYLKLNPGEVEPFPSQGRDVSNTGRMIGDLELTIYNPSDFDKTKHLINEALKNIGG